MCVCVCVMSNSIIAGNVVCRAWLTYIGPSHQFLDELNLKFITLDGSDTPSVEL